MPSVLITGANRGIGLGLARQYAADGWRVFATCRNLAACEALANLAKEHGELSIHELDVTDHAAIEALAESLTGTPIDVLINNAGVLGGKGFAEGAPDQRFGSMDYGAWARTFEVNTMAAMKFAEAFADHVALSDKKVMAAITSHMGSLSQMEGGFYIYRSSKVALNAVMKCLSGDLRDRGIIALVLHPGWVRTDMGTEAGEISARESAAGLKSVIDGLAPSDSGKFLSYEGNEIPW
jgi:NAD(P)-dependent dehydrogenase (short-subunit alcohol dehydrogenase family)